MCCDRILHSAKKAEKIRFGIDVKGLLQITMICKSPFGITDMDLCASYGKMLQRLFFKA